MLLSKPKLLQQPASVALAGQALCHMLLQLQSVAIVGRLCAGTVCGWPLFPNDLCRLSILPLRCCVAVLMPLLAVTELRGECWLANTLSQSSLPSLLLLSMPDNL